MRESGRDLTDTLKDIRRPGLMYFPGHLDSPLKRLAIILLNWFLYFFYFAILDQFRKLWNVVSAFHIKTSRKVDDDNGGVSAYHEIMEKERKFF